MTELNRRNAYIGWTDAPLSAAEHSRLRRLRVEWPYPVDCIVTSDLRRCWETAALLFGSREPDWCTSGWRELFFGVWEGKTFAELKTDLAYNRWLESPFSTAPPAMWRSSPTAVRSVSCLNNMRRTFARFGNGRCRFPAGIRSNQRSSVGKGENDAFRCRRCVPRKAKMGAGTVRNKRRCSYRMA
ncbi:histidine phosphatase family protein [Geobacillus stearothermophilus]|uniref:histidine phosphatase family protein n=1 Tax=Geobacillus stearothermophilus TaxID=1422 RepID=UPI003B976D95